MKGISMDGFPNKRRTRRLASLFPFIAALVLGTIGSATVTEAREIEWSGFTWNVRSSSSPGGPGPNLFSDSDESVFVDSDDRLHLKIRQRPDGTWLSSEVFLTGSLSYGRYEWEVASKYDDFAQNVVAGLFTYLSPQRVAAQTSGEVGNGIADTPHEIDIELTKAFTAGSANLHYVTHDPDVPSPGVDFFQSLNGSFTTHRFLWEPNRIHWESFNGHVAGDANPPFPIVEQRPGPNQGNPASFDYTGPTIPEDLDELVHINFWLFGGDGPESGPSNGLEHELIVTSFHYEPLPPASDFDADGDVDGDDFLIWQASFQSDAGGDADRDGDTDGDDFLVWQREFASGLEGAGEVALPEPVSVLTAVIVLAVISRQRSRQRP